MLRRTLSRREACLGRAPFCARALCRARPSGSNARSRAALAAALSCAIGSYAVRGRLRTRRRDAPQSSVLAHLKI